MVELDTFLAFVALAIVFIAVPGPSVLFTVGRALTVGRRIALLTVLGNSMGVYLHVIAVALGLGALVERSVLAFTVVKVFGAAYLIYLGVQAIRRRRSVASTLDPNAGTARPRRAVLDGFLVGLGNPKSIVFFAAVLPQFADPAAGDVALQMLLLGTTCPLIALLSDSVWAVAAATAQSWFARSERRMAAIGGTGGLMMVGLGATVLITGRRD